MAEPVRIKIDGLSQFNRSLRRLDSDAPKALRLALNSSADLLIDHTRPKIPELSGAARRSLVARSTRTAARVAVGGKKAPWYPWLDFGGQGKKAGRPAARRFFREGRYLYPTLREIRPQIEAVLNKALVGVAESAGIDVD